MGIYRLSADCFCMTRTTEKLNREYKLSFNRYGGSRSCSLFTVSSQKPTLTGLLHNVRMSRLAADRGW